ncbi:LOW QUALITY PROTEIN: hypothetical protein PanWU01x14_015440 [Parasponia andersonii]|uniref:Uncharacterized protein n=1 Tax=Parasponia andersonii TaxID=3476 RepID=A0A2P5E0I6_PARAD|nr:LOW QUALITY PROTEIN: hypothetical protein PanWU01x14_015440 [Parasponia andersonii]
MVVYITVDNTRWKRGRVLDSGVAYEVDQLVFRVRFEESEVWKMEIKTVFDFSTQIIWLENEYH